MHLRTIGALDIGFNRYGWIGRYAWFRVSGNILAGQVYKSSLCRMWVCILHIEAMDLFVTRSRQPAVGMASCCDGSTCVVAGKNRFW